MAFTATQPHRLVDSLSLIALMAAADFGTRLDQALDQKRPPTLQRGAKDVG